MQTNVTASDPSLPNLPKSDLASNKDADNVQGKTSFSLDNEQAGRIQPSHAELETAIDEQPAPPNFEAKIKGIEFNEPFEQILALQDERSPTLSMFGLTEDAQIDTEPEQPTTIDVAFQMVFTQINQANNDPRTATIELDMLPAALASLGINVSPELNALSELNVLSELTEAVDASPTFTGDVSLEGFSVLDQAVRETAQLGIEIAPAMTNDSALTPTHQVISQRDEISTALPAGVSPNEVTQVVSDNLVQQVQLTENGEQKQLTLQLHPAELGQVTLQVDWENDSLKVKIVANEMVATDILNQNKSAMVSALAEQGIDFDSLDVAYESAQPDQQDGQDDNDSRSLTPDLFAETTEGETVSRVAANDSSSLDIKV